MKMPATAVIGAIAVVAAVLVFEAVRWQASNRSIDAGFWYDDGALALSEDDAAKIGGPLTAREMATIRQLSRAEVVRALADLRINVTEHRNAFWRVSVVGTPRGNPTGARGRFFSRNSEGEMRFATGPNELKSAPL